MVFTEIMDSFKLLHKVEPKVIIGEGFMEMAGPQFVFSDIEEDHFVLNFEVGVDPSWSAEVMRIICSFVNPMDIAIHHKFFYDSETNELFFDKEAEAALTKKKMENLGRKQCPICERFLTHKFINTEGICVVCEKTVIPFLTFH